MAFRRIDLRGRSLASTVAALRRDGSLGRVAWLDGDASDGLGRWSYVGAGPLSVLGGWAPLAARLDATTPLDEDVPEAVRRAPAHTLALPYDLAWTMPIGLRARRRLAAPDTAAWWIAHRVTIALDHEGTEAWLVGESAGLLDRVEALLIARDAPAGTARVGPITAEPRAVHRDAIVQALEQIAAGDVYQVNLARRFVADFQGDPLALALAMRAASPVPLGAYVEGPDDRALIVRSMERFVSLDAATRRLETRPIKGTRPRASGDDAAVRAALLADEKERAEHAMIVDLMRNDLGRLAVPGSVKVVEAMRVEPYARLSHMVSIVEARARPDVGLRALLEATFPPGSVTGAPKLAAVEHIERLERFARGFYTGAVGHVARDGSLALAVTIRAAQVGGGEVAYFAGGGIVEASDPEREVDETELKARVLTDAAQALATREKD